MISFRSGGHGTRELAGSMFMNSRKDLGYRASRAPRQAAARQIQSSSGSLPIFVAYDTSASGACQTVFRGPRASASNPTTAPSEIRTTAW